MDCKYLSTCPIYNQLKTEVLKNLYTMIYCKGAKQQDCSRLKMREEGKVPPRELLPDGKMLTPHHFR
ncbi:MAG: hypothetical protein AB1776_02900 [Bacillota bacterium]